MKAYCDRDKPEKAEEILKKFKKYKIHHIDEVMYNMIIDAFARRRKMIDALRLFEEMKENGLTPNVTTYNTLINAFMKVGDLKNANEIFNKK